MLKNKIFHICILYILGFSNLISACQPLTPLISSKPTELANEIGNVDVKPSSSQIANPVTQVSENHFGMVRSSTSMDEMISELMGLELNDFYDKSYLFWLGRDPQQVVSLGLTSFYQDFQYRWTDVTDSYIEDTYKLEDTILQLLHTYDRSSLSVDDQITYDLYEWFWMDHIQSHNFLAYHLPGELSFSIDIQDQIVNFLVEDFPLSSLQDFEAYINLVESVTEKIDQVITLIDRRKDEGIVPPKVLVDAALQQTNSYLAETSSKMSSSQNSQVYIRFANALSKMGFQDHTLQNSLLNRLLSALNSSFFPAYQKLADYLANLESKASESVGLWQYPQGISYYRYLIKHFSGSDLTPEQLTAQGQQKVIEIQQRLFQLGQQVNLSPLPVEFSSLVAGIDGATPSYQVIAGDISIAGQQQISRYQEFLRNQIGGFTNSSENLSVSADIWSNRDEWSPPSLDPWSELTWFNSADKKSINANDLFVVTALDSGFDLVSNQSDVDTMPLFRRSLKMPAYRESWQSYFLYRLSMGNEISSKHKFSIGQHELFLYSCLVVDSGIHANGWSMQEGSAFLESANGISAEMTRPIVERIVAHPGEILSYATSLDKMITAQQMAEAELKEKFTLQDFNNFLLAKGMLPISEFDKLVGEYILQGTKLNVPNIQP